MNYTPNSSLFLRGPALGLGVNLGRFLRFVKSV